MRLANGQVYWKLFTKRQQVGLQHGPCEERLQHLHMMARGDLLCRLRLALQVALTNCAHHSTDQLTYSNSNTKPSKTKCLQPPGHGMLQPVAFARSPQPGGMQGTSSLAQTSTPPHVQISLRVAVSKGRSGSADKPVPPEPQPVATCSKHSE